MSKRNLRTGEVANQAGVSIATLRYYERRGLIPPPSRTSSGYRAFDPQAVRTVRLIKRAQALGFTLKEIQNLLSVVLEPAGTCSELHELALTKLTDLERQIASLQEKRTALADLLDGCPDDTKTSAENCEFLARLEAMDSPCDSAPD